MIMKNMFFLLLCLTQSLFFASELIAGKPKFFTDRKLDSKEDGTPREEDSPGDAQREEQQAEMKEAMETQASLQPGILGRTMSDSEIRLREGMQKTLSDHWQDALSGKKSGITDTGYKGSNENLKTFARNINNTIRSQFGAKKLTAKEAEEKEELDTLKSGKLQGLDASDTATETSPQDSEPQIEGNQDSDQTQEQLEASTDQVSQAEFEWENKSMSEIRAEFPYTRTPEETLGGES